MTVRLRAAKSAVAEDFEPGHPGREVLLALADEVPERDFDALFPVLIRLLRAGRSVGGVKSPADAGRRGGGGAVRGDVHDL